MRIVTLRELYLDAHFPIVQAQLSSVRPSLWSRFTSFITYRRKFMVIEDYVLYVPSLEKHIFVPKTFVFDGASVPKILNGIFSPNGMLLLGACPHDFGYRYQGLIVVERSTGLLEFESFTKKQLDSIFKDLCEWESGMPIASSTATTALSLFGFMAWKSNKKIPRNVSSDYPDLFMDEVEIEGI